MPYQPRYTKDELIAADVNDRRRLAVTEIHMALDALPEGSRGLTHFSAGQIILRHADESLGEDDTLALIDKVSRRFMPPHAH